MNLALKYRPNNFGDLIGQDVLVRILSNSFDTGELSVPLLMVGASGVGKTTCARIVALCLNCERGPTATPCCSCGSCTSILESRNPDVVEMDAASNTGVDDIRVILESSNYMPTCCRFRVYIIDEVHMLSTSAFNALLKTLESPAQHVRFIMATTEARKVPVTVASRCLRLDLLRLSVNQLFAHLKKVANLENIQHDDKSLMLIAENSAGSVRNSLLLLEQASIYSKMKINVDDVMEMLGCIDRNSIEDLTSKIIASDVLKAIEAFRELCRSSATIAIFEGIQKVIYELCLHSVGDNSSTCLGNQILGIERARSTPFLSRMWQLVSHGIGELKGSESQQQTGEMIVVRLCYLSDLPSPQKLASVISSKFCAGQGQSETSQMSISDGSSAGNQYGKPDYGSVCSRVEKNDKEESAFGTANEEGCDKKNDVSGSNTVYNPGDDEVVADVMNNFKGASVVGFKCLDI
ncbi:DNA polymerase III subunit gamma/tau [Candidatus Anaplasma sp. TIGMIC]|uniref:DNA polymerase III subunit gamma/tau n=1 Tax=Candidatus Anaplasma sp. TIGMIC TaxID=3020713 RepID=UPI0023301D85|nr:DNA polymerase III subunit gamma/tau [Candidatus Anaplasma sp. TIGMIC]MDB1135657.1 DNA polymerase III subunit gamma/tau [Candidatus Anaplasma sp. TIGMIC]